jgi:hypothetical protein
MLRSIPGALYIIIRPKKGGVYEGYRSGIMGDDPDRPTCNGDTYDN